MSFIPDSNVEIDFTVDINSIEEGSHVLFVRAKDESDNWSLTNTTKFYKIADYNPSNLANINYVEYFPSFANNDILKNKYLTSNPYLYRIVPDIPYLA